MEEEVVLVDSRDNELGTAPKLDAHRTGALHRAISVFIFNSAGEMLLQQRAQGKYHSPGLWSNTCCTHPRPGEKPHGAALRRLREEMGLEASLDHAFSFIYKADLGSGLSEHELDHVFVGYLDTDPKPDPAEIGDWRWVTPEVVQEELTEDPSRFSVWFPIAFTALQDRSPGIAAPDTNS